MYVLAMNIWYRVSRSDASVNFAMEDLLELVENVVASDLSPYVGLRLPPFYPETLVAVV